MQLVKIFTQSELIRLSGVRNACLRVTCAETDVHLIVTSKLLIFRLALEYFNVYDGMDETHAMLNTKHIRLHDCTCFFPAAFYLSSTKTTRLFRCDRTLV